MAWTFHKGKIIFAIQCGKHIPIPMLNLLSCVIYNNIIIIIFLCLMIISFISFNPTIYWKFKWLIAKLFQSKITRSIKLYFIKIINTIYANLNIKAYIMKLFVTVELKWQIWVRNIVANLWLFVSSTEPNVSILVPTDRIEFTGL